MKILTRERVAEGVLELIKELGQYPWLLDVRAVVDSGGPVIEVIVNGYNYPKDDPLPRVWNGIPFCVVKKLVHIKGEKVI